MGQLLRAIAVAVTLTAGCRPDPSPAPAPVPLKPTPASQPTTAQAVRAPSEPRTEEWKSLIPSEERPASTERGYGFLGLMYESGPPPLVVRYVVPGSGASDAGVKPDDKILQLDSIQLPDSQQIKNFVRRNNPGSVVALIVDRKGSRIDLHVRLIDPAELDKRLQADPSRPKGKFNLAPPRRRST